MTQWNKTVQIVAVGRSSDRPLNQLLPSLPHKEEVGIVAELPVIEASECAGWLLL